MRLVRSRPRDSGLPQPTRQRRPLGDPRPPLARTGVEGDVEGISLARPLEQAGLGEE